MPRRTHLGSMFTFSDLSEHASVIPQTRLMMFLWIGPRCKEARRLGRTTEDSRSRRCQARRQTNSFYGVQWLVLGYDDIPEYIVDKEAVQPEEWDEESDGEWEPPKIKNPEFKGRGLAPLQFWVWLQRQMETQNDWQSGLQRKMDCTRDSKSGICPRWQPLPSSKHEVCRIWAMVHIRACLQWLSDYLTAGKWRAGQSLTTLLSAMIWKRRSNSDVPHTEKAKLLKVRV